MMVPVEATLLPIAIRIVGFQAIIWLLMIAELVAHLLPHCCLGDED